jgi:hypothetical protein
MYYSGGNATYDLFGSRIQDKDEINLARAPSLDGPWERLRTGPLFLDGYQARDPMVFQLAPNSYIMYYTATENPSQSSKHVVAYRLSNDLINWSQTRDGIAFSDLGDDGTDAGGTESPFVAERDIGGTKYYYLFLGPQPYEGYLPPNYPGTNVYVSKDPKNFLPKNQVGHLGLHAVELVQDGANYLVSDAGWGKDYVSLYDFEFLNTPVKGSTLYALTAAKDKILKFSAGTWNPIGGQSTQLVAGGGLGVFSLEGGSLYLYDAAGRNVVSTTGSGYATNSNSLYRKDSNGVSKWNGAGDSWTNIGTAATTLYPGGKELFASNPWDGNIYHYSGSGTTWTKVGGGGDSWTANANGLFGTQFFGLYQYSGTPNYWIKVGNSTNNLISSGDKVYATDSGGSLKIYSNVSSSNKNAQWTKVANSATAFAACDDMLYALRGTTVYKQSDPNAFAGTPLPMGVYSVGSIVCGK